MNLIKCCSSAARKSCNRYLPSFLKASFATCSKLKGLLIFSAYTYKIAFIIGEVLEIRGLGKF